MELQTLHGFHQFSINVLFSVLGSHLGYHIAFSGHVSLVSSHL